jgi:DNA-binding response OmpR family regulator
MTRVLLIDDDRALAQSLAVHCIELGIAVRLAETLCEGVRYMVDGPVSAVLIDAALMRLPGTDQMRLFDTVAPGVPVVILLRAGAVENAAKYQVQGFQVVAKPFDIGDVLTKLDLPSRVPAPRPGAAAQVEALCP